MSNISGATSGGSVTAATTESKGTSDLLGKDAFLQLLVTQLRYQDPLTPMDNKEFISQMAQFTALEQTQNLNGEIQRLNAMAMLGRTVMVESEDGSEAISGVVERVVTVSGVSKLSIDGKLYGVEQVSSVE